MYNYTRWYYENNKTHVFSIYNMGDIAIEFKPGPILTAILGGSCLILKNLSLF